VESVASRRRRSLVHLVGVLAAGAACHPQKVNPWPPPPLDPRPSPGVDLKILDRSVDPCADFYQFSCGGWLASTSIPPDRPAWSRTFSEINERDLVRLRDILQAEATAPAAGDEDDRKLGDFYGTCMDEAKAQTASARTLAQAMHPLAALGAWPTPAAPAARPAVAALVAELQLEGADALFDVGSQQSFADALQVIGAVDQGGLGLPDRDYYLKTDPKSVQIRDAYRAHVARMFELDGDPAAQAAARAGAVLQLETALARAAMPRADHRDPSRIDHRLDRAGLSRLAPRFDWDAYFSALGYPDLRAINVMVPAFFRGLDQVLGDTRSVDLESYLAWHLLDAAAPALGPAFVDEDFHFRSRYLTGEPQLRPRWKRCVGVVDEGMGQALGRRFVAATFAGGAKDDAEGLVTSIEQAFRGALQGLPWMDAPTRAAALRKLALVYNQIGYPARWRDYRALEIGRESDLANRMNAAAFEMRRDLNKIGKPVDRTDWSMPPQEVNAYYDPSKNEMVFPAGILQPPFFSPMATAALNDGGIGMVMGHELTHGFDDEGRKFDGHGNLRDWWTPAAAQAFGQRADCLIRQYGAYRVLGDLRVDGRLTAGENIADNGGLRLAYDVFRSRTPAPLDAPGPGGLSPAQRFFIAFGQSWCTKRRDTYARMMVTVDPHAPPEDRVNGTVANLEEFARAFSCKAGAPLAPADRCRIW
jgi:putative endopeptidase